MKGRRWQESQRYKDSAGGMGSGDREGRRGKKLRYRELGTKKVKQRNCTARTAELVDPEREEERFYKAFPRQEQFRKSTAKYRLFGGAAGPGKTKALLWEAIHIARKYRGCDTLLLRRTYPELESSLLAQFRRDVPRN